MVNQVVLDVQVFSNVKSGFTGLLKSRNYDICVKDTTGNCLCFPGASSRLNHMTCSWPSLMLRQTPPEIRKFTTFVLWEERPLFGLTPPFVSGLSSVSGKAAPETSHSSCSLRILQSSSKKGNSQLVKPFPPGIRAESA